METVLAPNREGFTHLKIAVQRARSIAAEGGYGDLLAATKVEGLGLTVRGLDPLVGDDRTLLLLADLANGDRTCDKYLWLNLAQMVRQSPNWQIGLTVRNVRMPEPSEILDRFNDQDQFVDVQG